MENRWPSYQCLGRGRRRLVASTKRARRADGAASLRRGLPPQIEAVRLKPWEGPFADPTGHTALEKIHDFGLEKPETIALENLKQVSNAPRPSTCARAASREGANQCTAEPDQGAAKDQSHWGGSFDRFAAGCRRWANQPLVAQSKCDGVGRKYRVHICWTIRPSEQKSAIDRDQLTGHEAGSLVKLTLVLHRRQSKVIKI